MTDTMMSYKELARKFPTVSIIGRPNVGKSTLFNCLISQRRSITDPTPGVTRDLVEEFFQIKEYKVKLLDTGGIGFDKEPMDLTVRDRAIKSIYSASVILFVVDVMLVTPEDQHIAEKLRKYADRVILVVNKVDHKGRELDVLQFHELGYDSVIPISAAHSSGIQKLISSIDGLLNKFSNISNHSQDIVDVEELSIKYGSKHTGPRLAIVGKPNTGKSTLLNCFLDQERAIVSPIPGTTRDPVFGKILYENNSIMIVDTAGMRRKAKVTNPVEYYSVNRSASIIKQVNVALLMVDTQVGLVEQDKRIAALAIRNGVALIVVLSKWDIISEQMNPKNNMLQAMIDRIRFQFPILSFVPILPVSGIKGRGIKEILNKTISLYNQLNNRVQTSKLNQAVERWNFEYTPNIKGREIRIKYATQTSINPPRFVCFLNHIRGVTLSYQKFIENRIRRDFDFSEVPLTVEFRDS